MKTKLHQRKKKQMQTILLASGLCLLLQAGIVAHAPKPEILTLSMAFSSL